MGKGFPKPFQRLMAAILPAIAVTALVLSPNSARAATPTPTPDLPSWSPTPTPTMTPTPHWALKILEAPQVFSIEGDATQITATHNGFIPEGVTTVALGLWSRTGGQVPGPWRFHGLAAFSPGEPGTPVLTSLPWPPPEPGVTYELSARYRFDNQWDGPFFFSKWFDPTGPSPTPTPTPGPPPQILSMVVNHEDDPSVTISTNGHVDYPFFDNFLGFWYRQSSPPTPWTFMGFTPYSDGQEEVTIDLPFALQIDVEYEFASRIRTYGEGWATPFTTIFFLISTPPPRRTCLYAVCPG